MTGRAFYFRLFSSACILSFDTSLTDTYPTSHGTVNTVTYLEFTQRLHNPLCFHRLGHLEEARDVRAGNIVALHAVLLGSIVQVVENIDHDTL